MSGFGSPLIITYETDYWHEGCTYLSQVDAVLGSIIAPEAALKSHKNGFITLCRAIVGQQISTHAADKIWNRLNLSSPDHFLTLTEDSLKAAGLSRQKIAYLGYAAHAWKNQDLSHHLWSQWTTDEIITDLCKLKGIGRWTAEMVLIFYMMHPDIMPLGDVGLIKTIKRLYGADLDKQQIEEITSHWAPFRTIATWYLWRTLDPVLVLY